MLSEAQCPACRVILTLPSGSEGRKLKCPNCGQMFINGAPKPASPQSAKPAAPASRPAPPRPQRPAPSRAPAFLDDESPRADGPLRDLFGVSGPGDFDLVPEAPAENDALALFKDDPAPRRKPMAGDARKQARRCPTCGGVVPVGMSLCATCGLDLDTGVHIGLVEDVEAVAPEYRHESTPLAVLIFGLFTLIISGALGITALIGYQKGVGGAEFLGVICLFGVFASIQFLRLRSIKLLMVALTLGVMVNIVGLIAIPVFTAVSDVEVVLREDQEEDTEIKSVKDKLDVNKVSWGIAIVFMYAASAVYLNSPPIRRNFYLNR